MAQQSGAVKYKGSIGDLTYLETKDGFRVRKKRMAVPKSVFNQSDKYKRQRENVAEFKSCVAVSSLFRTTFSAAIENCSDVKMSRRLSSQLMKVLLTDTASRRGERTPVKGDLTLLEKFDCNAGSTLSDVFLKDVVAHVDRASGKTTIDISAFTAENDVKAPFGFTHFKLHWAVSAIDFAQKQSDDAKGESAPYESNSLTEVAAQTVTLDIKPASTFPIFLLIGIRFYQEVNGNLYASTAAKFNSVSVVVVDPV